MDCHPVLFFVALVAAKRNLGNVRALCTRIIIAYENHAWYPIAFGLDSDENSWIGAMKIPGSGTIDS